MFAVGDDFLEVLSVCMRIWPVTAGNVHVGQLHYLLLTARLTSFAFGKSGVRLVPERLPSGLDRSSMGDLHALLFPYSKI